MRSARQLVLQLYHRFGTKDKFNVYLYKRFRGSENPDCDWLIWGWIAQIGVTLYMRNTVSNIHGFGLRFAWRIRSTYRVPVVALCVRGPEKISSLVQQHRMCTLIRHCYVSRLVREFATRDRA